MGDFYAQEECAVARLAINLKMYAIFFILVGKVVLLEGTKSALIISFPPQTINIIPRKTSHIIVIYSYHNL